MDAKKSCVRKNTMAGNIICINITEDEKKILELTLDGKENEVKLTQLNSLESLYSKITNNTLNLGNQDIVVFFVDGKMFRHPSMLTWVSDTEKKNHGERKFCKMFWKKFWVLKIVEGISSQWHYHLSMGGREEVLCGEREVMQTSLPLNSWGFKSEHIGETYCKECERIAKEKGLM